MFREFACHLPVQRRQLGLFPFVTDDAICARRLLQVPRSETSPCDCADIPPIVLIIEGIKIFCPTSLLSSVLSVTSGRGHCSTISKPSGARAAPRVVATVEASAVSSARSSSSSLHSSSSSSSSPRQKSESPARRGRWPAVTQDEVFILTRDIMSLQVIDTSDHDLQLTSSRGSAESLSLRGEVGHTGKATRTQVSQFLFF